MTERRVARVKSFLVEQGVPEADIDTKAFGKERNLTTDQVKESINQNTELTTAEKKRALARIVTIRMASNRRVDVTLNSAGQTENVGSAVPVQRCRCHEPDRWPPERAEGCSEGGSEEEGDEETIGDSFNVHGGGLS